VLACIEPGPDDMVLPKTSSSVFCSTNLDYILRSLGVKYLILAGCVTDQCVESAVRDACDLHYYVTLVTGTPHHNGSEYFDRPELHLYQASQVCRKGMLAC
jgi:nicotinamidase-related amidase